MKQSKVIGQAVNSSDTVTDIENKVVIENAVATDGTANCVIANREQEIAEMQEFASQLGIELPAKAIRRAGSAKIYKYSVDQLKNPDYTILKSGYTLYTEPVNDELLANTLITYKGRIFTLKHTLTPNNTVFYQLMNGSKLVETKEISFGDWAQRADYLKKLVSTHCTAYKIVQDSQGGLWVVVFGYKAMIHKMQEFAAPETI